MHKQPHHHTGKYAPVSKKAGNEIQILDDGLFVADRGEVNYSSAKLVHRQDHDEYQIEVTGIRNIVRLKEGMDRIFLPKFKTSKDVLEITIVREDGSDLNATLTWASGVTVNGEDGPATKEISLFKTVYLVRGLGNDWVFTASGSETDLSRAEEAANRAEEAAENFEFASIPEVEAGINTTHSMNPLLTAAAISAKTQSVHIGDLGGDDLAPVLSAAIDEAAGRTVILTRGVTYHLKTPVVKNGVSISVDATGAKIFQEFNGIGIRARGGFSSIKNIISFPSIDEISVSDASAFKVGGWIRIVSDDHLFGAYPAPSPTTDYRRGEVCQVLSVNQSTNIIKLSSPILSQYITNPRVGAYIDASFSWVCGGGGYFNASSDGEGLAWDTTLLRVEAFASATLDSFTCNRNYGRAVKLCGNANQFVISPVIGGLNNDPSSGQYGYGIDDVSGTNTIVSNATFGSSRHGYTTSLIPTTEGSSNLEYYGPTRGAVVSGTGHGTSQAHFDLHHGAEDCVFLAPVTSGYGPSGASVQLRGLRNKVINPSVSNCRIAIAVFSEDSVDENERTSGCEVIVPSVSGSSNPPIRISKCRDVILNGGNYASNQFHLIDATDTPEIHLKGDITLNCGMASTSSDKIFNLNNSTLIIDGTLLINALNSDPSGILGANSSIFRCEGDSASVNGSGSVFINSPANLARIMSAPGTGVYSIGMSGKIKSSTATLKPVGVSMGTKGASYSTTEYPIVQSWGNSNANLDISRPREWVFTTTLTADRTATIQNTNVWADGDHYTITRQGGGAFNLNIVDGSTSAILKSLAQGQWVTLRYRSGSGWYVSQSGSL